MEDNIYTALIETATTVEQARNILIQNGLIYDDAHIEVDDAEMGMFLVELRPEVAEEIEDEGGYDRGGVHIEMP